MGEAEDDGAYFYEIVVTSIFGRERALVDKIAKKVYAAARQLGDYTPLREFPRGSRFEVRLADNRIVSVMVEFEQVEGTERDTPHPEPTPEVEHGVALEAITEATREVVKANAAAHVAMRLRARARRVALEEGATPVEVSEAIAAGYQMRSAST